MRFFLFICVATSLFADIQVIPVTNTPQPVNAVVRIVLPEEGQLVGDNPVWITLRLRGFALGTDSPFPRADELPRSRLGQTLHIIVDEQPYFAYNGPSIDPFDLEGDYYQANYRLRLPYTLGEGMHTLRVLACRTYGESLKCPDCFDAVGFFLHDKKMDWAMSLRRPFLTYNEPTGNNFKESMPVILDFMASNCELSPDGYQVRATIDGTEVRYLPEMRPYYIIGLGKGRHTVRLELVDVHKVIVPGAYNDVTGEFFVR